MTEHVGEEVSSRLPFRMVDLGAVGVTPDPAEWASGTDYSHASKAFADVVLPDAPYVDETALARPTTTSTPSSGTASPTATPRSRSPASSSSSRWRTLRTARCTHEGDEHVARALAMREAFTPFWDRADELGMDVVLRTDMLTLTTPLEDYLTRARRLARHASPQLWAVYTAGLDELYAAAPSLDGVLVRIGEAGRVYDVEGWDYYSSLAVTSVDAVRAMLTALTGQAERTGRDVIFRSWSVGVGAVGDMHTNPESYAAVLDGIDSPALVVSTKYTSGDFYSHLPLNETLLLRQPAADRRVPEPSRVRELRRVPERPRRGVPRRPPAAARRQPPHRGRVGVDPGRRAVASRPDDPLPEVSGFWQLYELNTWLAGSLARDPDADVAALTADWARRWFSDDPATVQAIERERWPGRARPSPRACTSARSPSRRSRPSASSRHR